MVSAAVLFSMVFIWTDLLVGFHGRRFFVIF
jgi:hypothetical protein